MATIEDDTKSQKSVLFAFDFDHSLIDENSDVSLMTIVPHLNLASRMDELRQKFPYWINLMNYVMKIQFQHGCGQEDVLQKLNELKLLESMRKTLEKIRQYPSVDVVVISDANMVSIKTILEQHKLIDVVKTIHTNPATFDANGQLTVAPYHSHSCLRCHHNPNMCKGTIIEQIVSQSQYSRVVYVGDGRNDVCAVMHLSKEDCVVAREGYSLAKHLKRKKDNILPTVHIVDFLDPSTEELLTSQLPTQ